MQRRGLKIANLSDLEIPDLWERQRGETLKAFEAFVEYRDMDNRSYREVGQKLGKSKTQIEKWARKYFWQERVLSYVDYLDEQKRITQLAEIEEMNKRQIRVAKNLQAKAAQKLTEMNLDELDASDLVRFFITASELEREARGVNQQNVSVMIPPTMVMEWDWQQQNQDESSS
jgi:hypothetical protein